MHDPSGEAGDSLLSTDGQRQLMGVDSLQKMINQLAWSSQLVSSARGGRTDEDIRSRRSFSRTNSLHF